MTHKVPDFHEACYTLLREVPAGKITTYQDIAHGLGCRAYRAVGLAMKKNPYSSTEVPCHRVVKADATLGGYAGDEKTKRELLKEEGIEISSDGHIKDFESKRHRFTDL
mgnify:CR=1 FL=1